MRFEYETLQKIAREVRTDMVERGKIDPGKQRVRRKNREPEKTALLVQMAADRLDKYPPYRDKKGRLVLPFFSFQSNKRF
jgi:hypothetical protein